MKEKIVELALKIGVNDEEDVYETLMFLISKDDELLTHAIGMLAERLVPEVMQVKEILNLAAQKQHGE